MRNVLDCLRLNARMLSLALRGKWLGSGQFAASYDRLAEDYDESWLRHLRPVTDDLLASLSFPKPAASPLPILDLGCGTGYSTRILASRNPDHRVVGVDISEKMLAVARMNPAESTTTYVHADMLAYLASQPTASHSVVVSAWAIGYSTPRRIVSEASRILAPGGCLAFVVNRSNTLAPLFLAYRRTLQTFAAEARLAIWPRFPISLKEIRGYLQENGFELHSGSEGAFPLPRDEAGYRLEWLLRTGILAGFDTVLPITESGEARSFFERELAKIDHLEHTYIMAVAAKKGAQGAH